MKILVILFLKFHEVLLLEIKVVVEMYELVFFHHIIIVYKVSFFFNLDFLPSSLFL